MAEHVGSRLPPVSATAVGVAAIRAAEASRVDALFADPLAEAFVRAAGPPGDPAKEPPPAHLSALITWIRVRTRFLDDLLLHACAHGCRQIVMLGAGLDARAFRLALPGGVRLFELDLPDILAFKEGVIRRERHRPACERVVVPTDLTSGWARDLADAGFADVEPTVWVAEGLLSYLSEDARETLVDGVSERSAPGSRFGLTLASVDIRPEPRAARAAVPSAPGDFLALFESDPPADLHAWLGSRGWEVRVFDAFARARGLGLAATPTEFTRRHMRLVDATRG